MVRRNHGTATCVQSIVTSTPPLPANASVIKRWKFRRNLVIYVAHRSGLSQRLLADVFDIPRSRIAAIIKEFRRFGEPAGS